MSYVDLHLHLLPGVDDGPAELAASLRHARRLARDGVREATVTPHVGHPRFSVDVASIGERTRALQDALDAEDIPLRLHPGGEIHVDGARALGSEQLEAIAQGPGGSRWVLLEAPFTGVDARYLDACRRVRDEGFGVVIAHPERSAGFAEGGLERLSEELERGALLQVNVCSLLGRHGAGVRAAAVSLIARGEAHLLASDGHGGTRGHTLAAGRALARSAGADPEYAARLVSANPRALLRHGVLPADRPVLPTS